MALGGGTFTSQNKVLPGAYINFVSLANANATLSDRGVATMPLELDWGVEGEIVTVTSMDFIENSLSIFGYPYKHDKMKGLRDLFKNINTLYAYRLNGGGAKASNTYATAKYSGIRGNDLKIVIKKNVDNEMLMDVMTYLDTTLVDKQIVSASNELVDNDYVVFSKSAGLQLTAGEALSGGTNGTVNGDAHQTYIDKIESYSFNTLGVITADDTVKTLFVNFCKRMRDEIGAKFQVVLYNKAADYEGVINVVNKTIDEGWTESALVYWVTGVVAGCAIDKSNLNKVYDGEFAVKADYTQIQLMNAIKNGQFILHKVGADIRVLEDINSLVTVTEEKGDAFKENKTIRVIDQIANDTAVLFNTRYLGKIPNDESGRISLRIDIIKMLEEMQNIRAIENFTDADVTVVAGNKKNSVVINEAIEVTGTMAKLYMTTTVA